MSCCRTPGSVEALFTGGDRGLVDDVLTDPRLKPLAALRRELALDVGEPTKAVLLETPTQFRAVDVHIVEPGDREERSPYEAGGPLSQGDR